LRKNAILERSMATLRKTAVVERNTAILRNIKFFDLEISEKSKYKRVAA
jgi:hypothetical protein